MMLERVLPVRETVARGGLRNMGVPAITLSSSSQSLSSKFSPGTTAEACWIFSSNPVLFNCSWKIIF